MTHREVILELDELRKLDVHVPPGAYLVARKQADELYRNGMRVSEIADLCIALGSTRS